jgi:hypothetical protein
MGRSKYTANRPYIYKARFQPHGMARALFAAALAQALIAGMHQYPGSSVVEILIVNGFFVALFVGSAWLFRHAVREDRVEQVHLATVYLRELLAGH